ncbi:hypothetical protein Cgig2_013733 [Carnegiea gigantea]|uniref:Uncharacterized protein n=1 Tax=Carnegiea gigantea TaxID=171969 RepID=A0A9Q1JVR1_9CARY|nr:hypothetical protein Cgig2_013733 [Carnegiea gigantea]
MWWRLQAPQRLSPVLIMCLPWTVNPPMGTTLWCPFAAVRGCKKPLTLTESGSHRKKTATIPLGPTHTVTTAQATNIQQSQPRALRLMQHTLDESLGLKSRNGPHGLGEGSPSNDGLPSAVLIASKRKAKKTKTLGALNVRLFIVVPSFGGPSFVAFGVRAQGLAIQRHSFLILQASLDGGWRMKLHQLEILALGSIPAAVLYVLDIRLKVTLYAEGLRHHGQ